jgi:hypothetical protein
MNEQTLTRIAKQAALSPPMVDHYPEPGSEKVTFPPSPYYRFLKLIAEEIGSRLSVELGLCGGGGSLHLAMSSQQVMLLWNIPTISDGSGGNMIISDF